VQVVGDCAGSFLTAKEPFFCGAGPAEVAELVADEFARTFEPSRLQAVSRQALQARAPNTRIHLSLSLSQNSKAPSPASYELEVAAAVTVHIQYKYSYRYMQQRGNEQY
jgi:hypothetical protein